MMNNTTLLPPDLPAETRVSFSLLDYILELSLLGFTIIVGGFGNGTVLIYTIFIKPRRKVSPLDVFILSSALACFIMCITFLPLQFYSTIRGEWDFGPGLCTFQLMLGMLCTAVAQGANLLIAIYCYVKCAVNPHFNVTITAAVIGTIVVWLCDILLLHLPVILGFIHVRFDQTQMMMCWGADDPNFPKFVLMAIVPTMHLPTLSGIILYIVLLFKIRRIKAGRKSNKNEKAAKSMAGLFIIFMICLMPNLLLRFVEKAVHPPAHVRRYSQYILYLYFAVSIFYYINRVKSIVPPAILKILNKSLEETSSVNYKGTGSHENDSASIEKGKEKEFKGTQSVSNLSKVAPEPEKY